jgi:hypothetical protein
MNPIGQSIKPDGFLFYATYNHQHTSLKPTFNPAYLVPQGGLAKFFPGFDIIFDKPEAGPQGNISQLIARKPGAGT